MRRLCPLRDAPCAGAACAWMCEGGCAVAVLAGGPCAAPPEPARRMPRDAANEDTAGRFVERSGWRPIDYEI